MPVNKKPASHQSKTQRFISHNLMQLTRRRARKIMRKRRANAIRADTADRTGEDRHQKHPCCGCFKCQCKPPRGLQMRPLRQLEKYWKESELYTWEDTTDVSEFVKILASARKIDMPMSDLWSYSFLHALHPQTDLWHSFIANGAIFTGRTKLDIDWKEFQKVLSKFKAARKTTRSSNYYSVTLVSYSQDWGQTFLDAPSDAAERDTLAARLAVSATPIALLQLFETSPSRDLWKAMLFAFLENLRQRSKGLCRHYMLKCGLDRFLAARPVEPGVLSWWPHDCPGYKAVWTVLWPHLPKKDRVRALMYVYKRLKNIRRCTLPSALAQLCWWAKDSR